MINRSKLALYIIPIAYFIVGVIVLIGITLIAIRAIGYEFVNHIKNKLE